MAAACLASFAIFARVLASLYGLDWYYKNGKKNRKLARKVEEEDHITKEPFAEQLA
jgi:hypothetical protein